MNKICTTIEQSKRLIELGIDINTADMCYRIVAYNPNDTHVYQSYCFVGTLESDIPAWSLSALIGLIPKFSLEKDVSNNVGYQLHYNYNTTYYDDPVDACVEMICWLKKYKKI